MSGYGNHKSPWDNRNQGMGGMNNYQQQGMMQAGLGMQQGGLAPVGISYPAPRSNQASGYGQMPSQPLMNSNTPSDRVFTGTVTKLHDNFGFVDEDVFFQTNNCKGPVPNVGDRVLVEATYNANMPFKWNAARVTPLPGSHGSQSLLGAQPSQSRGFGDMRNDVGGGMGGGRDRGRDRPRNRSPRRRDDERKREDRERSSRKRSRTKTKSRSPPRRRAKHLPRYNVSVPKVVLNFPKSNVIELKKRYSSLYIPSDFFTAKHTWNEAFPVSSPFHVTSPSSFTVFNKEHVDPVYYNKFQYDPEDADYSYVAKVMLLASPSEEDLYEKTCHLIEKDSEDKDPREGLVHPSRALKFLVGLKGKSETMAIGGPWSPSLDGADPKNDPSVLIKTAIRTCGAMTGIDLSSCTKWTKFIEFHYRRQASTSKPARTETVVIFFPDIWNAMPNKIDFDATCELYAKNCLLKMEGKCVKLPDLDAGELDASMNEDEEEDGEEGVKRGDPTHWKELDLKNMKVNELKSELEARGQSSKGLKSQLQARLQKLVQTEEEAEEKKNIDGEPMEEEKEENKEEEVDEEKNENKELDEKTKEKIKSYYKTPASPCFFVHPNTKVKSGKFDCRVETLSVLLDYRSDDNKEGTFEISLFAELFNEMLMRDNAFKIYRAIVNTPEPVKEDKKDGKEDEKKDDKEKDDEEKDDVEKKSMFTRNRDLLLGCSYFDLSHIGYFEAKDLEDIFLTLDLELSRAEVKKLASKLAGAKDHINYRVLTDVEVGSPEQEEVAGAKSDKELASGFKQYVPGTEVEGREDASPTLETNKLVKFRGTVLDIEKLVEKMDKAEKVRSATDSRLVTIQKELSACKDQSDKYLGQRDKLVIELKTTREKMKNVEADLLGSRGEAAKYLAALKDVLYRVQPLATPPPPPKKEEPKVEIKSNGVNEKKTDQEKGKKEEVEKGEKKKVEKEKEKEKVEKEKEKVEKEEKVEKDDTAEKTTEAVEEETA